MPLGGRKLSIEEALALCYAVGFRGGQLTRAVALMTAESGRYVEAYNVNATEGGVDSTLIFSIDRGLFQINTLHISVGMAESFKAVPNAMFTFQLSDSGTDFTPWMAFVNDAHVKFMDQVKAVRNKDEWRELVPTILEELA